MPAPDVSIVVPTHDRPESLVGCLAAIEGQTGCGSFEVIVVDDGSRDEARVAAVVAGAPHARLVRLEGKGPAAARNAGARAARAPILCFTDDDCEPEPTWAARLMETVRGGADAVGGRLANVRPDDPYGLATLSIVTAFAAVGGELGFVGSGSMACRADVFEEVPFDERYPFASEDRDWSLRIISKGYRLERNLDAVVVHMRQNTLVGFFQRYVRYGEGAYVFRRIHSGGRPGPTNTYALAIRKGFEQGPRVGALVILSQIATTIGFARAARGDRRKRLARLR